jgi:hypothetical protein
MTLEHELKVYQSNLMELLGHAGENEGKYVAIKGDMILPQRYDDYESALDGAYARFGIGGFLVKKIERVEPVLEFTRDLR